MHSHKGNICLWTPAAKFGIHHWTSVHSGGLEPLMEAKFLQLGAVEEHSTMKKPEARETCLFILYGGLL